MPSSQKTPPTPFARTHACTNRIKHTRTWSLPRCSCSSFHGNVQNNEVRSCGGQSECALRTLSYPLALRVCVPAFVFVYECLKVHVDVPCRFLNQLKERESELRGRYSFSFVREGLVNQISLHSEADGGRKAWRMKNRKGWIEKRGKKSPKTCRKYEACTKNQFKYIDIRFDSN